VSAALTTGALTLSGGGTGPLVRIGSGGRSLALSMRMPLPAPVLSGATATYRGVLPGVDLRVTADVQGGFSEVLVVHDAVAAANPALKTLTLATEVPRLELVTRPARRGHPVDLTEQTGCARLQVDAPQVPGGDVAVWAERR
jgi:hypothetical protein